MNCDDFNRLVLRFVDGRLDADQLREVQAHVDACDECRAVVADQKRVSSVLASRPDSPVSSSFASKVNERIDEEGGWWGVVDWHWLALRTAPVAAALLIVAGVFVGRTATDSTTKIQLSNVIESWAAGDTQNVPVPSVLWQPNVSEDSMLLTVLAAPPDATISETNK